VSLLAGEFERQGITTVNIVLLRFIAEEVQPPRAIFVPYRHGYPLGEPNNPKLQNEIIETAFRLLEDEILKPPVLVDFPPK
jgi:hypothetical protein